MLKKIGNVISTVLVAVMVLLAILLAGARLLGMQVFTVLSGSMEPNYHVGSIIYVKEVDPAELKVGDAISFMLSENTVATHRIVEVVPDGDDPTVIRFRTKGDNNTIEDSSLVRCNNVLGKVVGTIPYLGYVSDFVQHPPGTYITMGAAAILILVVFLPDMIAPAKKKKDAPVTSATDENEKLKAEIENLKAQMISADTELRRDEGEK